MDLEKDLLNTDLKISFNHTLILIIILFSFSFFIIFFQLGAFCPIFAITFSQAFENFLILIRRNRPNDAVHKSGLSHTWPPSDCIKNLLVCSYLKFVSYIDAKSCLYLLISHLLGHSYVGALICRGLTVFWYEN